ncbi:MAG: DUF4252 domain-containing protein [Saprospiraceae bacterium]
MKQLMILVLLSIPMLSVGQNKAINNFYQKYKTYKNVTNVSLGGWVLKLATKYADDDEAKEALRHVSRLKVLFMENGNIVEKTDVKQLLRQVRNDDFEELMTIQDGKSKVNIFIKENKKAITNLLIVVNGEDDFVLLSLKGELDFEDLSKLNIDVEGGEYLKKVPKKKKLIPQA